MKLLYAQTSPYVRKVLVVAHETGQADAIERVPAAALPTERNPETVAHNPLGKIPTLITAEGAALFDSRVICEYLDARSAGPRLFPAGEARWDALARQALADGLLDAALLTRYERVMRPEALRWEAWEAGQLAKIAGALDRIEADLPRVRDRLDIGTVATACALGYLDFRFPDLGWRAGRPGAAAWYAEFGQRPSMQGTAPPQG
ncbi:glutathione S-transferase [Methylobacterium symbioticum]|uniref:Putative GST-like protein YibF n=1 Tax=Methylobacterium symbioticum TaxID=2584084 RepID=A0A509EEV8_9HYPH|nr:glutathione S-transferase [Methylobacterium symbioticum]VUD72668.1 putative GST-like protein YibF [Methylobacterium symbioticum]